MMNAGKVIVPIVASIILALVMKTGTVVISDPPGRAEYNNFKATVITNQGAIQGELHNLREGQNRLITHLIGD